MDKLEVGDEVPPFARVVDLSNWNRYAAVNDEFVPIHMDDAAGIAAGYPTAFGMGNLQVSYIHAMLRSWLAGEGRVTNLSVQFRQPSTRGVLNKACGVITAIDGRTVDLDVWVQDGEGTKLTPGTATVELVDGGAKGG